MKRGGWGSSGGPWSYWGKIPDGSWRYVNRKGQQVWPPTDAQASGQTEQRSAQDFVAASLSKYGYVPGTKLPGFIPIYGGAKLIDALGGYAAYKTGASATAVLDFYENWFRQNGWQVTSRRERVVQARHRDHPVRMWIAVFPNYFDDGSLRFEVNVDAGD